MGHVDRPPDLVEELRSMKAQIHELQQRVRAAAFLSPVIAIIQGGSVSLPNASLQFVSSFSMLIDTAGMWNAGSPDRLTVVRDGVYVVVASVDITADGVGVGQRYTQVQAGDYTAQFNLPAQPSNEHQVSIPLIAPLEVGDTIQILAMQESGTTRAANDGRIACAWLGVGT